MGLGEIEAAGDEVVGIRPDAGGTAGADALDVTRFVVEKLSVAKEEQ